MNWDQIKGQWKQYTSKAREKWGDLTDDDLDRAAEAETIRTPFPSLQRLGLSNSDCHGRLSQLSV